MFGYFFLVILQKHPLIDDASASDRSRLTEPMEGIGLRDGGGKSHETNGALRKSMGKSMGKSGQ